MLLLAKLAALGVIIWFYTTANKVGEPSVKWAIIGLIGYLISWFLVDLTLDNALSAVIAKRGAGAFVIGQIPTLGGLAAAYLIRKKMLNNVDTAK
jgi:hypothetical protein